MYLGVDIGSRNSKFALIQAGNKVRFWEIPTPELYRDYVIRQASGALSLDLEKLKLQSITRIAATGYGRNNSGLAHAIVVSEIIAHVEGANRVRKPEYCLLDLGGQDTKVIHVKQGMIEDFVVNDKCAAGSGRYLENMATILGVDLPTLFQYYQEPVDLSTTCAVYAESELIGKMAEGYPIAHLCAGVNHSTFLRLQPMLERFARMELVFVGGGAKNSALIHYLQSAGYTVTVPEAPAFNAAIGCLEIIRQELEKKHENTKSG